jgi:site-specific recombinase XerD
LADPEAALDQYLRAAADLQAGRQPNKSTISGNAAMVKVVANRYLTYQLQRVDAGEITPRWFEDCLQTVRHFTTFVGPIRLVSDLHPEDFHEYRQRLISYGLGGKKGFGAYALERSITVVRAMFRYAHDVDVIERPMKYGKVFDRPSASMKRRSLRSEELENGKRLFTASEICSMLDAADMPLRAMILLGVNGGFGNTDCACLPIKAVDLKQGIIEFDRPKTSIERVVPLWVETVEALREPLIERPSTVPCPYTLRSDSLRLVWITPSHPKLRELLPKSATKLARPPRATVLLRPLQIVHGQTCCIHNV